MEIENSAAVDRRRLVNLNILPVLRALLSLRSVTHAAAALNMSQSAVSDALARLRAIFEDELLIPSGRGFILSKRAVELEGLVLEALDHIELLVNAREFRPEDASGRIQIAASDYATLAIGPWLARKLNTDAPGLSVQFRDVDESSCLALMDGHLDFLFVQEEELGELDRRAERALVIEDDMVVIGTQAGGMETKALSMMPQNVYLRSIDSEPVARPALLQPLSNAEPETISLPSFMLLPFFVEGTDIIAALPSRLAERLSPAAKTRIVETSAPARKIRTYVAWSPARTDEPLHRWVRDQILEIGSEIMSEYDDYSQVDR